MRRDVGGSVYLLGSNDAADQLEELKRHFGIKYVSRNVLLCGSVQLLRLTCLVSDVERTELGASVS
jgi:hypothetical protein